MFEFFLGAGVGLIVGWNFLPQPKWIAALVSRASEAADE